ncbi:hypothetical protein [Amycolatopsis aidingensis]|uniref:hypothetical protein n=1 Tax=Amycolatopsis aidingensis TaxID=2842453 RepID=UPI001C0CA257|nr:hypothetical protein [Amycolatopsis aidingensis]
MALPTRRWDLLLIMTAPPHYNDTFTTVLRLSEAMLRRGGAVRVWACGYANMLTQDTHGETKPKNTRAPEVAYPSSAAIVRQLIAGNEGRFGWIGCTTCSAERGATNHIAEVLMRSPGRLMATMATSAKTIFIGGA